MRDLRTPEQRALCLAARTRLDHDAAIRLRGLLRAGLDWDAMWTHAHVHDVLPLVARTLRRADPEGAAVPRSWTAAAQRRAVATLVRNRALENELATVVSALRAAGVEPLPVKGVVLARTLYGSLGLRGVADLDVLVRPADLRAARAALAGLGYGFGADPCFETLHHPYHDPQYFRVIPQGGEVCLELHHALWSPRFFAPDDGVWERRVTADLCGAPIGVLSPGDTLLHLAIHRTRSPLRLRMVCDMAELVRRLGPTLAWQEVVSRAHALGARAALHSALTLTGGLLGAPPPPGVLDALAVSSFKRRVLERTCGAQALFREARPGDVEQQPRLALRVLEQDGGARIARAFAHGVVRKGHKARFRAQRRRAGVAPAIP